MKIPPAIQRAIDAIQHWPPVVRLLEIMTVYNAAGGGLLAAGLAYGALFAALTGLLFAVGLIGFVINDVATREQLINQITAQFPPLEPIARQGLITVSSNAGAFSVIGVAGLGWSASQFYGSVDAAFARIFKTAPERGPIDRIIRGLLSVLIIVGALAAGIVTSGVQAFVSGGLPAGTAGDATRFVFAIAYPVVTVVVVIVATGLIYKLVPNVAVSIHALGPPALVFGLIIALLTELFVFLAPRLVGSLSVFGSFAAVFAALVWLGWAFQALLIGASWTADRLEQAKTVPGPTLEEVRPDVVVVAPGSDIGA